MRIRAHLMASTVVACGAYAVTRSYSMVAGIFVGGVLVDLDHLIDYWREHGIRFDPWHFMDVCNNHALRQIYLVLHSFELLIPCIIAAVLMHHWFVWGMLSGYFVHMLLDQFGNGVRPWSYFFLYRWKNGFNYHALIEVPYHNRHRQGQ